jgi:hypothetical protein
MADQQEPTPAEGTTHGAGTTSEPGSTTGGTSSGATTGGWGTPGTATDGGGGVGRVPEPHATPEGAPTSGPGIDDDAEMPATKIDPPQA